MFTKDYLKKQLEEMGAPRDRVVVLHSSLRAIGETEGRGEGLLDVLIDYFTSDGGLLCIPTHTWGIDADEEGVVLDLTANKTCVGKLTEIAAGHPEALRSLHPTHSVAVFGDKEKAREYIDFDEFADTCTHPKGCFGKLFDCDGYVFLVGVGHNKNTYIHSVEEMLDVPNRLTREKITRNIRLRDGSVIQRMIHCHYAVGIGDVSKNYVKYESAFRKHGAIADGMLGNASVQMCNARTMKQVVELVRKNSGGAEILADNAPLDTSWY